MKKLIAILLSVLMLCATISFTTVAAAEDTLITVEAYVEETELNAGDEFDLTINLLNNPGINGAIVALDFDEDVFEVVTYYDEDEEDYFNQIEVAAKWNTSSNKYITLGPVGKCSVMYLRADAKSNQLRTEEEYYTVTLRVKEDAVSGTYDLTPNCGESSKVFFTNQFNADGTAIGGKFTVHPFEIQAATVTVNGTEPDPSCKHEYDNACDVDCNLCYEAREVEHNVVHVEAVAPTCTDMGNIEYWYCDVCGMAWLNAECTQNTNLRAVVLPVDENAHTYLYACDQYCNNCGEKTNPGAKHNIVHVEAKEAVSCIEFGNKEYWRCDACGGAWLDAAGRYQTNMMSVLTAGPCISNAEYACQEGECINCHLPYAPDVEHEYTNAHDASCNVCGAIREMVLPADQIVLFSSNSITEIKGGLAFLFDAAVNGITFNEEHVADYTNATVIVDGVEYKLITMGAIVNNKQLTEQTLDNVDDKYVRDVEAAKVFEYDNGSSYAIRVINIPAEHLNSEITVRPYFIYEADGAEIVVYGEDSIQSYNGAL